MEVELSQILDTAASKLPYSFKETGLDQMQSRTF
jgi:hypothetical protein